MLTVQLSISIWWIMLALIPLAVVILCVSSLLPARGRLHDLYESVVSSILFYPVPGAPQVSLIKFLLAALSIVVCMLSLGVYNDGQRDALPTHVPLDKQILYQAKGWRSQRNLYLTCLALALWWAVYTTLTLKNKIASLLDEIDHLKSGRPASSAAASSSAAKNNAPTDGEAVLRRLPKPSAPEK